MMCVALAALFFLTPAGGVLTGIETASAQIQTPSFEELLKRDPELVRRAALLSDAPWPEYGRGLSKVDIFGLSLILPTKMQNCGHCDLYFYYDRNRQDQSDNDASISRPYRYDDIMAHPAILRAIGQAAKTV